MIFSNCKSGPPKPLVQFDVAGSWDRSGRTALIVQYQFRTNNPDQPYYNAHDADDWTIACYTTDDKLKNRKLLASWPNGSGDGGGIIHTPVFWLKEQQRIVYTESQMPSLYAIDRKQVIELIPPADVVAGLVAPDLIEGVMGDSPIPSPDGKTIAVWFNTSFISGGPLGPQIHTHFVSFFDSKDGKHISSHALPFDDKELDPWLVPAHNIPGQRYRFLWNKKSTGIYIISKKQSWLVGLRSSKDATEVNAVPERALATNTGRVAGDGRMIQIHINKTTPNQTTSSIQNLPGWIAHPDLKPINPSLIKYARP